MQKRTGLKRLWLNSQNSYSHERTLAFVLSPKFPEPKQTLLSARKNIEYFILLKSFFAIRNQPALNCRLYGCDRSKKKFSLIFKLIVSLYFFKT
jgi:hypothetical protein